MKATDHLKLAALKHLQEVNAELLADGVPKEVVAFMSAHALTRLQGPSYTELARKLFPVEPMPLPSGLVHYYEPERD